VTLGALLHHCATVYRRLAGIETGTAGGFHMGFDDGPVVATSAYCGSCGDDAVIPGIVASITGVEVSGLYRVSQRQQLALLAVTGQAIAELAGIWHKSFIVYVGRDAAGANYLQCLLAGTGGVDAVDHGFKIGAVLAIGVDAGRVVAADAVVCIAAGSVAVVKLVH
jgi:hypothetical protein